MANDGQDSYRAIFMELSTRFMDISGNQNSSENMASILFMLCCVKCGYI